MNITSNSKLLSRHSISQTNALFLTKILHNFETAQPASIISVDVGKKWRPKEGPLRAKFRHDLPSKFGASRVERDKVVRLLSTPE
jgi:hypothetical protein